MRKRNRLKRFCMSMLAYTLLFTLATVVVNFIFPDMGALHRATTLVIGAIIGGYQEVARQAIDRKWG